MPLKLKVLWPGKTRSQDIRNLQEVYLTKINQLASCEVIETKEARGLSEKCADRIKEIEASRLEKHLKDEYVICLFHEGKEMNSVEFAKHLQKISESSSRALAFVVGGFLGLDDKLLKKADFILSFSQMTFSHELVRIVLLEQIYRSLTILKGIQYAK